ncbi:MAG: DNA polymerase III subunit alpha, partial [Spirochaetia bacterium]|nr:DNA polymerase III subunit alpha [Spirochaetia bacterium]
YGIHSFEKWVEVCKKEMVDTIAISDINSINGIHHIRSVAKEEGIGVIISATLTTSKGPVWVFVKSPEGFSRLTSLLSLSSHHSYIEELTKGNDGLIIASSSYEILSLLKESKADLYGAITPHNFEAVEHIKKLNIPPIAIEDALFISKEDIEVHKVLRAIAVKKTVGSLKEEECASHFSMFHTKDEYERIFSPWPLALKMSEKVAALCKDVPLFLSFVFPSYPSIDKSNEVELRERVIKGAHERYGELNDGILERIEYELSIINKKGFAPYFLIMDDIVSMASNTCGRGSGAASIVSYALSITQVDPIAQNLYFERFLTLERIDMPDIDVDFAWDERDEIISRVIKKFGLDHCARVANHNFFHYGSALRETAKAYGVGDKVITDVLSQRNRVVSKMSQWNKILSIAHRIEGMIHLISMHCGGIVITPKPISCYAPVTLSREGYPLLGWEKDGVEDARLVKIDLLGNRSLAVIRDTLHSLETIGVFINKKIFNPIYDEKTIEMLQRGDSMGVFYIESPAMRQLQKKTLKGDFDHIVIHSSLIRPAANRYISEYVQRVHGKVWKPIHPDVERILQETYGIMCYQEDVSKVAIVLAGFSEYDADQLRKVISKKNKAKRLSFYETEFRKGCSTRHIDEEVQDEVWSMMLSFDGYSFCKPHSASYAMVSFQSAYLRAHYPSYFMAAVLSNQGGYYHSAAYVSECRRMGLITFGPDINESEWHYRGDKERVIIGFMAIKGLQYEAAHMIYNERKKKSFFSLNEVSERLHLDKNDIVALVDAGVFDSISETKRRSEQLRDLLIHKQQKNQNQGELFEKNRGNLIKRSPIKGSSFEELKREFAVLSFLRSHHILYLYAKQIIGIKRIKGYEIGSYVEKKVTLIGWPITRRTVVTKGNLLMDFISFEDETTLYDVVLFPPIHKKYHTLLGVMRPLIIRGIVHQEVTALIVEVTSIQLLPR